MVCFNEAIYMRERGCKMKEITEGNNNEVQAGNGESGLIELTEQLLSDARTAIASDKAISVPIFSRCGGGFNYSCIKYCNPDNLDCN